LRVQFSDIFEVNPDGTVRPLTPIHIGANTIDRGELLSKGAVVGGMDIAEMIGRELEIDTAPTGIVLTAIY
jgi:hypothetical protein